MADKKHPIDEMIEEAGGPLQLIDKIFQDRGFRGFADYKKKEAQFIQKVKEGGIVVAPEKGKK